MNVLAVIGLVLKAKPKISHRRYFSLTSPRCHTVPFTRHKLMEFYYAVMLIKKKLLYV